MFSSTTLWAQQALFDVNNLTSPEINNDRSVTFRMFASAATTVEVEGDFGEKDIIQSIAVEESCVIAGRSAFFALNGFPNHLNILIVVVAQAASLACAAAGVVLRIEVEHQFAAPIVTQTDVASLFVLTQNLGCFVSNVHHACFFSFYI